MKIKEKVLKELGYTIDESPEEAPHIEVIDKTLAEVGKVIDEITYGCDVFLNETACCGDISFDNEILLCNKCRVYYDKIQNIKQKLGIK